VAGAFGIQDDSVKDVPTKRCGECQRRLREAAPALLEACEEALITTTERCRIERINPDSSPTVLCLRAAIESAKGESK